MTNRTKILERKREELQCRKPKKKRNETVAADRPRNFEETKVILKKFREKEK